MHQLELQRKQMSLKDKRMKLTSQILNGIKVSGTSTAAATITTATATKTTSLAINDVLALVGLKTVCLGAIF